MSDSQVNITETLAAKVWRTLLMACAGESRPGEPIVIAIGDGASLDANGQAVAYVARIVLGKPAAATQPASAKTEAEEFYVMGEVERPGVYPLAGREITVKMALASAGFTLSKKKDLAVVLIRRLRDGSELQVVLSIDALIAGGQQDVLLRNGDVVTVRPVKEVPSGVATQPASQLEVWRLREEIWVLEQAIKTEIYTRHCTEKHPTIMALRERIASAKERLAKAGAPASQLARQPIAADKQAKAVTEAEKIAQRWIQAWKNRQWQAAWALMLPSETAGKTLKDAWLAEVPGLISQAQLRADVGDILDVTPYPPVYSERLGSIGVPVVSCKYMLRLNPPVGPMVNQVITVLLCEEDGNWGVKSWALSNVQATTQPATQPASASQVKLPEHAVWLQAAGDTARSFLAAIREGGKADPYSLTTQEYRQAHAGGLERLVERMDLSKAGPSQFAVAVEAACVVISPISPRNQDMPMSLGLGMIRIGDVYRIRDIDMLPSDEAVKQYVESFRKAYPAARVGFESQTYRTELMRQKADLEIELAASMSNLGPEHPKTLEIGAKLRNVQMLLGYLERATSRPTGKPTAQPATSSAKGKDPEAVRELALSVLRAIKEDDLATLKSLSAGSQQGWLEVDWMTPMSQGKLNLVGEPPVGWSESNLKSVSAEIRKDVLSRNPDAATKVLQTLVQGDWAAALSPVTSSQYLVMVFVKTDGGWRFATLDQSKGNLADDLAKHMANIPKNLKVLRQLDHSSASKTAPSTSSGPAAGPNRGETMSQPIASPATGPAIQLAP
jgi:hypothetical protein